MKHDCLAVVGHKRQLNTFSGITLNNGWDVLVLEPLLNVWACKGKYPAVGRLALYQFAQGPSGVFPVVDFSVVEVQAVVLAVQQRAELIDPEEGVVFQF